MVEQSVYAAEEGGIGDERLKSILAESVADGRGKLRRVLLVTPDHTRRHSGAGRIANLYFHLLEADGCRVELLTASGTHQPMTPDQYRDMYGDIPLDRMHPHSWRTDVVKIGQVPAEFAREVSGGLYGRSIDVELNRLLFEGWDLILSIGQVVPHEVVGMANHSKNLFVGCGGSAMINASHILGAYCGMEKAMGRDHAPARRIFDYAAEHFLKGLPLWYALTVTGAPGGKIRLHGLFIGRERAAFERAVALSQEKNIVYVDRPLQKVVTYLDGGEFKTTWVGDKAIYRTRMAIADGGELIILAPGVECFGEDPENDRLIRKYGYSGRERIIHLCETQDDLKENLSAAAHLIHGSTDGRFSVTYCTKRLSGAEIESVGYRWMDYGEAAEKYDPSKLAEGYNTLPDGEEIYFVPNPALGLWALAGR